MSCLTLRHILSTREASLWSCHSTLRPDILFDNLGFKSLGLAPGKYIGDVAAEFLALRIPPGFRIIALTDGVSGFFSRLVSLSPLCLFPGGQSVGILCKSFPLLRKSDGFLRKSCVGVGKRFVFGSERRISLVKFNREVRRIISMLCTGASNMPIPDTPIQPLSNLTGTAP